MKLKYIMVTNAVINMIVGIGMVLVPGFVLALFVPMPMYNLLGSQLLGTGLIGFAVLNFFARNAKEGEALLRPILLANLVSNGLGFVLALMIQLGGTGTATNWFTVVVPLLFALGFAYLLVMSLRPSATLASERQ